MICFHAGNSQSINLQSRFLLEDFKDLTLLGKFQVKVDMGEPILTALDVPTKLPANKDSSVVKSDIVVDGETWSVTCVSMGNPHCVTFGRKGEQV